MGKEGIWKKGDRMLEIQKRVPPLINYTIVRIKETKTPNEVIIFIAFRKVLIFGGGRGDMVGERGDMEERR